MYAMDERRRQVPGRHGVNEIIPSVGMAKKNDV